MVSEPVSWTKQSVAWLGEAARSFGFALAGVAGAIGATEAEAIDANRFTKWIDLGRAGEMEYLKRRDPDGRLLRSAIHVAIPWARSVVVCSMSYRASGPLSIERATDGAGWIARYAWSGRVVDRESSDRVDGGLPAIQEGADVCSHLEPTDYHDVMLARLRQLEQEIQSRCGSGETIETRCYVDTGPMVERAAAVRAGLGWVGKNTTVIHQAIGSWTLLASIVTSIPVAEDGVALPSPDRCGSCTRCLDACPTQALVAPHQMDASACIAYLTIEKKGSIEERFRTPMGRQIFGCDICQDVCPWNGKAPTHVVADLQPRRELINPDLEWLAAMTSREFKRWFRGSPLERTGLKRLKRNVAIAMGNSGEFRFTERLRGWADGPDEVLAETARWALRQLVPEPALPEDQGSLC